MLILIGSTLAFAFYIARIRSQESGQNEILHLGIVWFIFVVVLGAGFRIYGLDFGLPDHRFHPDEWVKVRNILRMLEGKSLDPGQYLHPSLLLYSTIAVHKVFSFASFFSDWDLQPQIVIAGRTVSLLASIASVILTYLIARLLSCKLPEVAAYMLAVTPLPTTLSRYLKEDALLLVWILAAIFFTLVALKRENPRWLVVAGAMVGFAAATKYPGVLALAFIGITPWLRSGKLRPNWRFMMFVAFAAITAVIVFAISSPYVLINWETAWRDINQERIHMGQGHGERVSILQTFGMYGLVEAIIPGFGLVPLFVASIGLGALIIRPKRELLLIALCACLFYSIAELASAKNSRYLLPVVPCLAIFAAQGIGILPRKVAALALFALLITPLWQSLLVTKDIRHDTRASLGIWITENIPRGTTIVIPFRAYAPELSRADYNVVLLSGNRIAKLRARHLRSLNAQYLIMSSLFTDRYQSQFTTDKIAKRQIKNILTDWPKVVEFSNLRAKYAYHNPDMMLLKVPQSTNNKSDIQRSHRID